MESLFLIVLSILAIESADSIRLLYKHFLSIVTEKSLNAFYYACSYAKFDGYKFMSVTARLALQIIPEHLHSEPVFLCVDDTMIAKSGQKFENVSKLFDHAAHNGSNYLNGHCFVSLMLCVPVWKENRIVYQSVPLGYRMWTKEVPKLELAAGMVRTVMPELNQKHQVLLLFDSWYAKKSLVRLADEYENLDIICNARYDSAIYNLPQAPTGKRGRPAKRGKRLSIIEDFSLSTEKIGDYYVGVRKVLTNIFGDRYVHAYVTAGNKTTETRRLLRFMKQYTEQDFGVLVKTAEISKLPTINLEPLIDFYTPLIVENPNTQKELVKEIRNRGFKRSSKNQEIFAKLATDPYGYIKHIKSLMKEYEKSAYIGYRYTYDLSEKQFMRLIQQ